jgi:hypothetical protein
VISRTWIKCLACNGSITARVQVGHESAQAVTFACPHCGTDIRLTLILDEPPNVKVRWDDNCESGDEEGKVVNIGAGFVIPRDKLHQDKYFPSFQAPRPDLSQLDLSKLDLPEGEGPLLLDTSVALGTLPYAAESWRQLQQALRFRRTGQRANEEAKLEEFFGGAREDIHTLEFALYAFFMRFMASAGERAIHPLFSCLKDASVRNAAEYQRLVEHYVADLKDDRFHGYSELFTEYFRAYGEYSQTLVYARNQVPLPADPIATSSDFEQTKMYYGNAFELLGTHLDLVAALNNIIDGRAFDQMKAMDLKQYRSINKAGRTTCFASNAILMTLVTEYDSTVRNASHHRWFRLDAARSRITYRSGGTGALQQMSYAEYLTRCNAITLQIMALAALELLLINREKISL